MRKRANSGRTLRPKYAIADLHEAVAPFVLNWRTTCRSTNDVAAMLRRTGRLFAPALVLTGRQTAGRGRGANVWHSPGAQFTGTFVVPADEHLDAAQLPLVVGLALRRAVVELTGEAAVAIKWPNDLVFGGRKLAGILCERIDHVDLIGIGLNVDLSRSVLPAGVKATSLAEMSAGRVTLNRAAAEIARQLSAVVLRRGDRTFAEFADEFRRHDALAGRQVRIEEAGGEAVEGMCRGIDGTGRLLVRTATGERRVVSGHVALS